MSNPNIDTVCSSTSLSTRSKISYPFMPSGVLCLNSLDRSIFNRCVWLLLIIFFFFFFLEIYISKANNVDPDQTPRSVTSDLGLHCLSNSLFMGRLA